MAKKDKKVIDITLKIKAKKRKEALKIILAHAKTLNW